MHGALVARRCERHAEQGSDVVGGRPVVSAGGSEVEELHGPQESLTIDIDATLITLYSEKETRPGTTKAATGSTVCTPTRMRPAKRSA